MEYHYKGPPAPKKFQTKVSAEKVIVTVFWNSEAVVLTDFWEEVVIVNQELWNKILKKSQKAHNEAGGQKLMSSLSNTVPGLAQVPPQLMLLHVWGLQFSHIQPIPLISLIAILLVPETEKVLGGQTLFPIMKLGCSMPVVSEERERQNLRMEFKSLSNLQKCIKVGGDYVEK
jgi:hypothetical protein